MKSLREFLLWLFVAGFIVIPFFSFAQTPDQSALIRELQKQIDALNKQIQTLQKQLADTRAELGAEPQQPPPQTPATMGESPAATTAPSTTSESIPESSTPLFTRTISRGTSGEDVRLLQEFLAKDKEIYPSGLITGFFGPLTESALKRWQTKHGIEAVGVMGPKTTAKLKEIGRGVIQGLLEQRAGASGIIPPGLLSAPGIQKKFATSTPPFSATSTPPIATTTPPAVGTSTPAQTGTTTPSSTIPAIPAQPISQTGTTTIPAIPAQPAQISTSTTDAIPPSTPTNFTASTTGYYSPVWLSWSKSTDNIGVIGYKLYKNGALLFSAATSSALATLSYTDSNITPSTTYSYAVAAFDAAGNISAQAVTAVTTPSPPTISPPSPPPAPPPSQLSITGSLYDAAQLNGAHGVAISGSYAYVAAYDANRLTVVDISNPASPMIVGSVYDATKLATPYSIAIAGTYAYVTSYTGDRLTIVDIANPRAPTIVGSLYDANRLDGPWSIAISGKYAYVGLWSNRFTVVDVSSPSNPVVVASLLDTNYLAGVKSIHISGNYAYAGLYYRDFITIISIANPLAPTVTSYVDLRAGTQYAGTNNTIGMSDGGLFVDGRYAYAVGRSRLTIVDIGNPLAPTVTGWLQGSPSTPYPVALSQLISPQALTVSGRYAYIAAGTAFPSPRWTESGFTVVDVSNPAAPTIAGAIADKAYFDTPFGGNGNLVAVSGNYAYIAASTADRLTIVDVSAFPASIWINPPSPSPAPATDTAPPIISNIQATAITATSAVIVWTTNEESDTQVEYGATEAYGSAASANLSSIVTNHSVSIYGLAAGTTHHYRVKSSDKWGNAATSQDQTFTTDVSPPPAPLPAPTAGDTGSSALSAVFGAGGQAPSYSGIYTLGIRFRYDAQSISSVQSFRVYQKKPGEGAFSIVATFANPSSLIGSGSSIRSGTYGTPNSWILQYINSSLGVFWETQTNNTSDLSSSSNFPVGEYNSYVVAVDASNVESAPSATMKHIILDRTTILSPSGIQTSSTPTFSWTVASGWPSNPSYYIRVYDTSSVIWSKSVSVSASDGTGSKTYDGPVLDPTKTYTVFIDAPGLYDTNKSPYTSMNAGTQTFSISSATTTATTTALTPAEYTRLAQILTALSNALHALKQILK